MTSLKRIKKFHTTTISSIISLKISNKLKWNYHNDIKKAIAILEEVLTWILCDETDTQKMFIIHYGKQDKIQNYSKYFSLFCLILRGRWDIFVPSIFQLGKKCFVYIKLLDVPRHVGYWWRQSSFHTSLI